MLTTIVTGIICCIAGAIWYSLVSPRPRWIDATIRLPPVSYNQCLHVVMDKGLGLRIVRYTPGVNGNWTDGNGRPVDAAYWLDNI